MDVCGWFLPTGFVTCHLGCPSVLGVVAVVVSVISLWLWCRTLVVGFFVRGCFLLFLVCLVGFLSIRVMIARRVGWSLSCFVWCVLFWQECFGNGVSGSWLFGFGSLLLGITFLSFWWAGKWSFFAWALFELFCGGCYGIWVFDDFGWFLCLFWGMF